PERTWSAHSRRKSAAKTPSRMKPRIAIRRAFFGVTRYGSTTVSPSARGRGRRGARVGAVLAKELHLGCVVTPVDGTQQPPHDCVHGRREDEVQQDLRREPAKD